MFTEELLKIFALSITERAEKGEEDGGDEDYKYTKVGVEANKYTKIKTGKKDQATANTLSTITYILAFLQAVESKSLRVTSAPLSLHADKRAHVCFRRWYDTILPMPSKTASQNHTDLTGVLSDVATRLHSSEALRLVVAAQREAEK